ncbi:MAG: phosphohydrolase [Sphingomonadales bacterium]|nr:phosphohydrolase [Sphingomonadales bacterium]
MVRRKWFWLLIALIALLVITVKGYWNATRDPVIRTAGVIVADWPVHTPPVKVMLIADTHVAGPDMPPERLRRILSQLNAQKPDLILLAGDFVSRKRVATQDYTPAQLAAPFAILKAPLGVLAVTGNHDHWDDIDAITLELRKNGVTVIANGAVKRGPMIIGGVDDEFTDHDNLAATYAAMDALDSAAGTKAPRIILSHGPDIVPGLPAPVDAVFTGHTHCGQIVLPFYGPVSFVSRYGMRFNCGLIDDAGQKVVVTAGLGTSILPLRYGAPPDVWLVTLTGSSKPAKFTKFTPRKPFFPPF